MAIKSPTKVIIAGAAGRMGRTLVSMALRGNNLKLVGGFETAKHPGIGEDLGLLAGEKEVGIKTAKSLNEIAVKGATLIDFTSPVATMKNLKVCIQHKMAMVIGTTGLSKVQIETVKKAGKKIPIVMAPNMSVGVNILFQLAFLLGATLGDEYDVELTEAHHRHKKDAPSGTALELARRVADGRKIDLSRFGIFGRKGMTGARKKGSIGIHAIRGGDVIGEHTLSFMADGERVELTHRASSREAFGRGAMLAAHYLRRKKMGLFNMRQVLML